MEKVLQIINESSGIGEILIKCYLELKRYFAESKINAFNEFIQDYIYGPTCETALAFRVDFARINCVSYFKNTNIESNPQERSALISLVNRCSSDDDVLLMFMILDAAHSNLEGSFGNDIKSARDSKTERKNRINSTNNMLAELSSCGIRLYFFPINAERRSYFPINAKRRSCPSSLSNKSVDSYFSCFCFIKTDAQHPFPSIYPFYMQKECGELRIVTIPRIGTFSEYVESIDDSTGRFYVAYKDNEYHDGINRLIGRVLDLIIKKQRPNIVVFPEYAFSERMLDTVSNYLKREQPNGLLFVIAGTTFINKNGVKNNICHTITNIGKCIPVQHKAISYTDKELRRFDSDQTIGQQLTKQQEAQGEHFKKRLLIEELSEPGKLVSMFSIPGFGLIQLAVCKDFIEYDNFIKHYSEAFKPAGILVPAYSGVVEPFETISHRIAENNAITSVIVNCCSAADELYDKNGGYICFPYYNKENKNKRWDVLASNCKERVDDCIAGCVQCVQHESHKCSCNNCQPIISCYNVFNIKYSANKEQAYSVEMIDRKKIKMADINT